MMLYKLLKTSPPNLFYFRLPYKGSIGIILLFLPCKGNIGIILFISSGFLHYLTAVSALQLMHLAMADPKP